ncbi:hypothetical protein PGT21_029616 [Puccinia graminis f. sp. tritici]|uniref:RING-type domain-containing protein n=1 Tax=Puccinia graminis f. sp. tritici TaxID=56615 RepID=A0A5B0PZ05_PUCGR|nr:hypothetical protein PGT21_029616 [Puccinia graminis f. sp. tritici]
MPTLIILLVLVGKCLAMRFPAQSTQFPPQELQHVIELSECGPDPLNSIEHESSIEPDTIVSDPDKITEPLLNLSCRTGNQATDSQLTSIVFERPLVNKDNKDKSMEKPLTRGLNGPPVSNQSKKTGKEIILPNPTSNSIKFDECPICLDELRMDSFTPCKGCNKQYHIWCIEDWKEIQTSCPTCRASLLSRFEEVAYFIHHKVFCQCPLISLTAKCAVVIKACVSSTRCS